MSFVLYRVAGAELAIGPLVIVGHFFLFCNVFRISRRLELIWTAVFLLNCAGSSGLELEARSPWLWILAVQTPVTFLVIWKEMRTARYHGIYCRRINQKSLPMYLAGEIE